MISRATPSFWRAYGGLTENQQEAARRVFRLFTRDPGHNSLQFKKLRGRANDWSVRVTLDLRVVGRRQGDTIEWVWIGSHNEFDKLFG